MAKRGGFPGMGMPGNMNNLMKQAQKMQRQMEENQKALEEKEFTATAGGGAVEVTISGKREVTKVKLQEEVVDPDDIEMLEDLITTAVNEASRKADEMAKKVMQSGAIVNTMLLEQFYSELQKVRNMVKKLSETNKTEIQFKILYSI